MSTEENIANVQRFVEEFNRGNLDIIDEMIAPEFSDFTPASGEPTAPDVYRELGQDLRAAFPDLKVSLDNLAADGDELTGRMTLTGTRNGTLWGVPTTGLWGGPDEVGKQSIFTAPIVFRFVDGKFIARWEDINIGVFLGILREIGVAPMPEDAHRRPVVPVRIPEAMLKIAFNGTLKEPECAHLDQIKVTEPTTDVCAQCVASGDDWPAVRMCLTCGFVGCCDTSVNKHMKAHFEETGHPIFRSIQPGESWVWCYVDNVIMSKKW